MQNTFSQSGNDSKWFLKKSFFKIAKWQTRPPRDPPTPFMANAILNFHFDYPHPSLSRNLVKVKLQRFRILLKRVYFQIFWAHQNIPLLMALNKNKTNQMIEMPEISRKFIALHETRISFSLLSKSHFETQNKCAPIYTVQLIFCTILNYVKIKIKGLNWLFDF